MFSALMIAAGRTGEKFLSFGSTGGIGYDLFLVGVARGWNYVHFFIAAYRTGGNFLSILCAGRCCDYRCAIAVITGGSQHFNLLIAAYTAGCDFLPFLSAGRLRDYGLAVGMARGRQNSFFLIAAGRAGGYFLALGGAGRFYRYHSSLVGVARRWDGFFLPATAYLTCEDLHSVFFAGCLLNYLSSAIGMFSSGREFFNLHFSAGGAEEELVPILYTSGLCDTAGYPGMVAGRTLQDHVRKVSVEGLARLRLRCRSVRTVAGILYFRQSR